MIQFLFYSISKEHEWKYLNKKIANNTDNDEDNKYVCVYVSWSSEKLLSRSSDKVIVSII